MLYLRAKKTPLFRDGVSNLTFMKKDYLMTSFLIWVKLSVLKFTT